MPKPNLKTYDVADRRIVQASPASGRLPRDLGLRCIRQDGSVTWQKQPTHAAYFALHDLTHYAVETALGYKRGFFGLIAEGWEVDDTTGKGARGALPAEAVEVERIVGLFDSERASGALWTAEEFNEFAPRALTDAD
jgi:hypothetical protein